MNKQGKKLVKSAVCAGAAFAVILSAGSIDSRKADKTTIATETSLAGVSLALEDYKEIPAETNAPGDVDNVTLAWAESGEENVESADSSEIEEAQEQAAPAEETKEETPEEAQARRQAEKEAEEAKKAAQFENVGISKADDFVYIRKKPSKSSKAVGKLYRGCAATLLEKDGKWVKIESGNVKGYIKSEFLAMGIDVEDMVEEYGTKWATVNTTTLKVRDKQSTDSMVLTLVPEGGEYRVLKEGNEWTRILVDGEEDEYIGESTKGYVSNEFIDVHVEFKKAISIKEELAKIRRQKRAKRALERQQARLAAQQAAQAQQQQESVQQPAPVQEQAPIQQQAPVQQAPVQQQQPAPVQEQPKPAPAPTQAPVQAPQADNQPAASDVSGAKLASFAQNFVGNPYVWGGTSLTNGADCSGFTQAVYASFGISIPRDSRSQAASGTKVSLDSVQPGDLIFYASGGTVNHVAMYIGGGQVVHASDERTGITISNMNYRTPYAARRYWS